MKKIVILGLIFLFQNSFVIAACPVNKIQQGKTCAITTQIRPVQPSNNNVIISNPSNNKFAPSFNGSAEKTYKSDCQFGICPTKTNDNKSNK